MKLHMKRIWSCILITLFMLSLTTGAFANNSFYEDVTTEKLSRGVTQKSILRFTQEGWLKANVLFVDLKDETLSLDILQSIGGVTTKETLSTMVKRKENVVAAINGDFFYLTNPDSPMGIMAKDGEIISSPAINNKLGTFYVNQNNNAFAEYLDYEIRLTSDKGVDYKVAAINKVTQKYQFITVIDKNWGSHSPGAAEDRQDIVEIVVIDNIVAEIRQGQPSIEIPENGYIILSTGTWGTTLTNNISLGDQVTIDTKITPGLENIKLALGGGTLLVSNGKVVPFTQKVTGNHPRTAVGISKDRSQLILVTVDGRNSWWPGINGDKLARLMLELGSYESVIMDGGGSTTMVSRGLGSFVPQLTNNPSEGTERRIVNALAVISNIPPGQLNGIKAETSSPTVFKDTSVEIQLKGFDNNFNPIPIDSTKIKYALKTGGGSFNGNSFIPSQSGNAIIMVEYLGKIAEVSIRVLEEPVNLEISPKTLVLASGRKTTFSVIGVDAMGYRAPIKSKEITWRDINGLGSFSEGVYTAGENSGKTQIEGKYRDSSMAIPVIIGNQQVILDNFNELKVNFNRYPQEVAGSIQLVTEGREGTSAVALEYDFTNGDATRAAYIDYPNGGITLSGKPTRIGVWVNATEASTQWIRGRVYDANGTAHVINFKTGIDWTGWKYLEESLPTNISYPVRLDRVYVVETNKDEKVKGRLIFDDLQVVTTSEVSTPPKAKTINKDPLFRPSDTKGTKVTVHSGITLATNTLMDRYVSNNLISRINSDGGLAIFTGGVSEDIGKQLKAPYITVGSGYSIEESSNHVIIRLNNSKQGIRNTNFYQWPFLKTELEKTNKKTIFIIMPNPVWGQNGFTDPLEANLLADMLTAEAEKGKNVFVLHGGEELTVKLHNGVRYIATGKLQQRPQINPSESYQYVEFNVLGDNVTYGIKSLFK